MPLPFGGSRSGEGAFRVCRMDVDVADVCNQPAFDLFSQIV
jgi:hypothetical protein